MNLKIGTDSNSILLGDFNTPLSPTDKSTRQKLNKDTRGQICTMNYMALIDIHRTFRPTDAKHRFFSSVHGNFSKIGHV